MGVGRTGTVRGLISTLSSSPIGPADTGRHSERQTPSGECRRRHRRGIRRHRHSRWRKPSGRTSRAAGNGSLLRGGPWGLIPDNTGMSNGTHRSLKRQRHSSRLRRASGLRVHMQV